MPRDWDAAAYDRLAYPMTRWGEAVVGWLDLRGGERVLDAGCGTGRVTASLLDRLPHGQVIALDGSPSMIDRVRERFADDPRVQPIVADLAEPLPVDIPVDAILSTATFHWILDHDALFRNLAAVARPGAQLVAQCGGAGNIASIKRRCMSWARTSRVGSTTQRPMRRGAVWRSAASRTWRSGSATNRPISSPMMSSRT